jgi:hypothetical protein
LFNTYDPVPVVVTGSPEIMAHLDPSYWKTRRIVLSASTGTLDTVVFWLYEKGVKPLKETV